MIKHVYVHSLLPIMLIGVFRLHDTVHCSCISVYKALFSQELTTIHLFLVRLVNLFLENANNIFNGNCQPLSGLTAKVLQTNSHSMAHH